MKEVVAGFNQEKALVGAFSVIVQLHHSPINRFAALITTPAFSIRKHFFPGFQDPDSDPLLQELEAERRTIILYKVFHRSSPLFIGHGTRQNIGRLFNFHTHDKKQVSPCIFLKTTSPSAPPSDVLYGNISVSKM